MKTSKCKYCGEIIEIPENFQGIRENVGCVLCPMEFVYYWLECKSGSAFENNNKTYGIEPKKGRITVRHKKSSNGIPLLIALDGTVYRPEDVVGISKFEKDAALVSAKKAGFKIINPEDFLII